VEIDKTTWMAQMNAAHHNTAIDALEIQIVDADANHLVLEMPITAKTKQPFGLLHGGISMLLAETAASSHACWGIDFNKVVPVGIEINGSHLRSATEGTVRTTATVIRRSRTLIVHQVDVWHVESDKQLCTARVTNYYKPTHGDAVNGARA
jgi:1,4-dihydroxy-2-naphthoyl-CoA hydrolase